MANTTFNTRIQNKIDTYENYNAVKDSFIPLKGEVCIATVSTKVDGVQSPPQTLIKIGDGTSTWGSLKWLSATAADVYPWAKASVKPTYQASEIEGLEDYISGQIEDTDTQYQIIASGTNGIQLQSRPKTGGAWTNVGSPIPITYTLETGTTNGTVSFNGTEVAVKGLGSAAYTESSAYAPAGAGVPPTDTAQPGDVPTWDGEQVVWAAQQGGIRRWTLLIDETTLESVDSILVSQDASGKEFNVSELIFDLNLPILSASPGYVRFVNGLQYVPAKTLVNLSSVGSTKTIWYGYGWIKLLSGVPALVSGGAKTNIYNASTVIRSYGTEFSQDISNIDSINSFGIYFQNGIDAGIRVRVWGR